MLSTSRHAPDESMQADVGDCRHSVAEDCRQVDVEFIGFGRFAKEKLARLDEFVELLEFDDASD